LKNAKLGSLNPDGGSEDSDDISIVLSDISKKNYKKASEAPLLKNKK